MVGKCLTKGVVYKAEITSKDSYQTKNYIGVTAGQFKGRYNNDRKSLNNYSYRKETEVTSARLVKRTFSTRNHSPDDHSERSVKHCVANFNQNIL